MIQCATLRVPKGMKKAVSISIAFCFDFLIRNENVTSKECKTKKQFEIILHVGASVDKGLILIYTELHYQIFMSFWRVIVNSNLHVTFVLSVYARYCTSRLGLVQFSFMIEFQVEFYVTVLN